MLASICLSIRTLIASLAITIYIFYRPSSPFPAPAPVSVPFSVPVPVSAHLPVPVPVPVLVLVPFPAPFRSRPVSDQPVPWRDT